MHASDEEVLNRMCGGSIPIDVRETYDRWEKVWHRDSTGPCDAQVLALIVAVSMQDLEPEEKGKGAGKGAGKNKEKELAGATG